jgi:hypothetical protein
MSKFWIEYEDEYYQSPLSSDVHRPLDCDHWSGATKFDPPLPSAIVGVGFKVYKIEVKGFILSFSSIEEIDHCVETFSKRILPTTYQMSQKSWAKGWQHTHWLTKFPGALKSYKNRTVIIKLLNKLKAHNNHSQGDAKNARLL